MHNYVIWSRDSREQLFLEPNLKQSLLTNYKAKFHQNLTQARLMSHLQLCYYHIQMIFQLEGSTNAIIASLSKT
jgi:hypothetical protein